MRGEDFRVPAGYETRQWITPACAGKTLLMLGNVNGNEDHPRMRGEDS